MSILISGMEMPKAQFQNSSTLYHVEGTIFVYPDGKARAELSVDYKERKSYPLVPVPTHGRLGDLDALFKEIGMDGRFGILEAMCVQSIIHDAPTIIPAEEGET